MIDRTWLQLAAATCALLSAAELRAQDVAAKDGEETANISGDIIVTAQRREERLQDVPISITAITADSLADAGVSNSRDLALVTPGLRIEAIGPYVQPSLRGITTQLTTNVNEANVATYVDGVYQPSLFGAVYSLPDVQQIDVLKGPQGTLFGRNATGGAVLINTTDPDLVDKVGHIAFGVGTYRTVEARAFVSLPLVADRLAASVTGYSRYSRGYQRNLVTGKNDSPSAETLIRGKLRFVPWDGADFVLTGMYAHLKDDHVLRFTSLNGNAAGRPYLTPGQPFARGIRDYAFDTAPTVRLTQKTASLRGKIEVGPGMLSTTTSYGVYDSYLLTDLDNTLVAPGAPGVPPVVAGSITVDGRVKAFSQELVYSTERLGIFQGVLGAYYFHSNAGQFPVAIRPYFHQYTREIDDSYALFGEVTLDLTDRLSVIGGLRFNHETRKAYWTARRPGVPAGPMPALPFINDKTWHSTTPRASIRYALTPEDNVYFTFSKGFKSGAFNANGLQAAPVDPETITAYELGYKGRPADNLKVNAAAFYYDYRDLQVSALIGSVSLLQNAAQARIKGAELNIDWTPADGFHLVAGGTWLDAKYRNFPTATVNVPAPNPACISGAAALGGNCTRVIDASGNRMIRAPRLSGNLSASYEWTGGQDAFSLAGTVFYSSRVYHEVGNRVSQSPYAQVNLTVGWKPGDAGLELKLWARNLTGAKVIEATTITTGGDEVVFAAPRTAGIEIDYRF